MTLRKTLICISLLVGLISNRLLAQVILVNENFSTFPATGALPAGWSTSSLNGGPATDAWRFNNPALRQINFPLTSPFAIFDAAHYSNNGTPEDVVLETPSFDASVSNGIFLVFDEWFSAAGGANTIIEGFNGIGWGPIQSNNITTENGRRRTVNVSSRVGGITNAKIRFRFTGNGGGFWVVDNIRIVAPLTTDAGVSFLHQPSTPRSPGISPVQVAVTNFGFNNITSATIGWSVNGVRQPNFALTGVNIPFSDTLRNLTIGNFNFAAGLNVLRVWTELPNGATDPNRLNDTLTRVIAITLCGTYTIGGNNPDFATFSDAATVLNNAGVTCPVVFKVRPGVYNEQMDLGRIPGSSLVNTVRFESENGDSSTTVLSYNQWNNILDFSLRLTGTSNISFHQLGIERFGGSFTIFIRDSCKSVLFERCLINGSQFRSSRSVDLKLRSNRIIGYVGSESDDAPVFYGNFVQDVFVTDVRNALVDSNFFSDDYRMAVNTRWEPGATRILRNHLRGSGTSNSSSPYIEASGGFISEVIGNRVTRVVNRTGILISADSTLIANNFVQTEGQGSGTGIEINGSRNKILHNSIRVDNVDLNQGVSLVLNGVVGQEVRNNILSNLGGGLAIRINGAMQSCIFSNNNYFSQQYRNIGQYLGAVYDSLHLWQQAIGGDAQATLVNPYFSALTNPAVNHVLMNNSAFSTGIVNRDIAGVNRGAQPDRGAREFDLCPSDAGVDEFINIVNPMTAGIRPIWVVLRNHGLANLQSVLIQSRINGQVGPSFNWTGNLATGDSAHVNIGNFAFGTGQLYQLQVFTSNPNNTSDCRIVNDSARLINIATSLCGVYTIGGNNPDFATFSDAATVLNNAGVTCPVVFKVRPGVYNEQMDLGRIPGSSLVNTVRFESENGDSSTTVLSYNQWNNILDFSLRLTGTSNISFHQLGIERFGGSFTIFIRDSCKSVLFEHCLINGSQFRSSRSVDLKLRSNRIIGYVGSESDDAPVFYGNFVQDVFVTDVRNALVDSNFFSDDYRMAVNTRWEPGATRILRNHLRGSGTSNSSSPYIEASGGFISEVIGNRVTRVVNRTGILISADSTLIANNFVQTEGQGSGTGIEINGSRNKILHNSIRVDNVDLNQGVSLVLNGVVGQEVRNNILSNLGGGLAIRINGAMQSCIFSNNNYFSQQYRNIGQYLGAVYDSLHLWQQAIGGDAQATLVNPYFSALTNPAVNHVLMNNSAFSTGIVNRDIAGVNRGAQPDRGAREFDLCPSDAGIEEIKEIKTFVQAGPRPIRVVLRNHGANPLSSVQIGWKVNGMSQPSFNWTRANNLASGDSAHVELGSYNFLSGQLHQIEVYTSLPNGITDCRISNDSARLINIATSLCGTYTIGGNNPDFATFSDAATVLNNAGVTCPVVFKVRPGVYNEQMDLGRIPGSSLVNTVRFESENGDSSTTVLSYNQWNNILDFSLRLTGTSNISFHQLGIERFGGSFTIFIRDSCKSVLFERCLINGSQFRSSRSVDLKLRSNRIIGYVGSESDDAPVFYGNFVQDVFVTDVRNALVDSNFFSDDYRMAVNTRWEPGATRILRNHLRGSGTSNPSSPYIEASGGFISEVIGNRVTRVVNRTGILISADSTLIANNFVQTEGQGPGIGIDLYGEHNRVVFNSLHTMNQDSLNSACLWIRNATGHMIKNNIFANDGTGYPVRVPGAMLQTDWDYNNYYSPNERVAWHQNQRYFNTQSWGMVVAGEANALAVNPFFSAVGNYNPFQRALNGAGIAAANILLDIEGEIRNQQAPDIGADEFMIDFGITELISPSLSCDRNSLDSVTIYLRQFGDVPFIDLRLAYQVNNGPIFTDTIPGAINNDIIYTFSVPANLQAIGVYTLKIWLIDTYDDNVNNDTLIAVRRTFPTPVMPIRPSKCFRTVSFNHHISVPTPHAIDSVWWYFGDGDSSSNFRPVHAYANYGTYPVRVVAYASSGCVKDTAFTLEVRPPDSVNILAPDTLCKGDIYTARSSDSTLLIRIWSTIGGQLLSAANDSVATFQFNQSGLGALILNFIDADSCSRSADTLWVYVKPNDSLVLNHVGQVFKCSEDTLHLQLSGNIDSLSLIHWYRNTTLMASGRDRLYATIDTGTYYAISIHPNGCTDTSARVLVKNHPSSNPQIQVIYGSTSLCPSDSVGLEVLGQGITQVRWFRQGASGILSTANPYYPSIAGNYIAHVVDSNGCLDSTANITILPMPNIPVQIITTDSLLCAGEMAVLSFNASVRDSIIWYQNGQGVLYGFDTMHVRTSGVFRVSVVDANGCRHFSPDLIINVVDTAAPVIIGATQYCKGDSLHLAVPVSTIRIYYWQLPTGIIHIGDTYSVNAAILTDSGLYRVWFEEGGCFSDTASVTIDIVPDLDRPAIQNQYIGCLGSRFELLLPNIPPGAELVIASEGRDTVIAQSFVLEQVTQQHAGLYRIFYKKGNCSSEPIDFMFDVFDEDAIDLPNVFTPNGDGFNDVFRPIRPSYSPDYRLIVFNRWGHKLFESEIVENGWDGLINGQLAEEGSYIYSVTYKSCSGEPAEKRGALKLMR